MNTNPHLENLFLRKKPARLLVYINKLETPYASTLAKKIDCTYAHTVKLLQKMEEHDLVKFSKDGRVKYIELTDLGKDLADEFEILLFRRMARASTDMPSMVDVPEAEIKEAVGAEEETDKKKSNK